MIRDDDDYKLPQVEIRLKLTDVKPYYSDVPMDSPQAAIEVMKDILVDMDREMVCVVNLDSKLKPINFNVVSIGNISSSIACVSDIMKSAILSNASGIILLHNHPSGDPSPSEQDYNVTAKVSLACQLMELQFFDHTIVGGKEGMTYSFFETHPELFSKRDIPYKEIKNLLRPAKTEKFFKIKDGVLEKYTGKDSKVVIPEVVTKIGDGAFYGCESLEHITIPEGVTKIGEGAFECCESLESIKIPDSVTKIGNYTFSGCKNLESITIPDSVTEIGDGAFYDCESLKEIIIPEGVTEIGEESFAYCENLEHIEIPDGVTKIGEGAFANSVNLEHIDIPEDVTRIGSYAFYGCESLKEIIIPEGVTEIGERAFKGCRNLKEITIPEGVTKIEKEAFSKCVSLKEITIPESVTKIGKGTFYGCIDLNKVVFPKGLVADEDAFYGCAKDLEITYRDEKPQHRRLH